MSDAETDLTKSDISLHLDEKWVGRTAFDYDRATNKLTYAPGRRLALGWHTLRIKAVDASGVAGTRTWRFQVVSG